MNDHDHDDGLVHAHGWATGATPARPVPAPLRPLAARPATPHVAVPDAKYDDGLVHSHGWACGERGRPASAA